MSTRRFALLLLLVLAPGPLLSQPATPVPADKGQILVKLPAANARLTIAGDPTSQTGESRLFESPVLEAGSNYTYELVATWEQNGKPVTVKRVVPILRGKQVLVDFTHDPAASPKEQPKPQPKPQPKEPIKEQPKEKPKEDKRDYEKLKVPPREKSKEPSARTFRFTYEAAVTGLKPGQNASIWLPIATTSPDQKVEVVERRLPRTLDRVETGREPRYGNEVLFVEARGDEQGQVPLKLVYQVTRYEVSGPKALLADEDAARMARYLEADALVPVTGKPLELLGDRPLPGDQTAAVRAIYDVVNSHMRYSKEGTGWGRGDAVWACDSKFGNCCDFHSLFTSLVRAQKIPVKFEIGFPLPPERGSGAIQGCHCWAKFEPAGEGWVPVDISEANKHPELRDYYFGHLTADRITFSTGRDIDLVPQQTGRPLNYFIYPHVEVAGQEYPQEKIVRSFSFQDASSAG